MDHPYHQALRFRSIAIERDDRRPAPYMLGGRKMYVLGTTDGAFRPIGDEHLVGEMGGVWAHPVRFAEGWHLTVTGDQGSTNLDDCHDFEGHLSDVELRFRHGDLAIRRTDFVAEEDAALFGLVEAHNGGSTLWRGKIGCLLRIRIQPTWFGGWETGRPRLHGEDGLIVAYDDRWQGRWGLAFGGAAAADAVSFGGTEERPTAELSYDVELGPGETRAWEFLLTADHQQGEHGARELWTRLTGTGPTALAAKRALYAAIAGEGVTLEAPDPAIVQEYELAKVNLHMLAADYGPYLPGYLLAGVPEYPQLFGCDTAYSIAGATAAGFAPIARSALSILAGYAERAAGRIPHEITTNGRVFHPGNTQETPQFAMAVWDYFRWTGDIAFLRRMYPICHEGVMEYVPALWDHDGDGYPWGDAMVERHGMGSLKLDSACYLYAAWRALAEMASVLGRPEAEDLLLRAAGWRERFERDWWLDGEQLYGDSLHSDLRPQLDGHWTQIVPAQLGIARPERAHAVLDEIERSFVNEYGLMHTRGVDDRVWTLPTGLLALAELRWGRVEQGVTQLHNIARTTRQGMLGSYKELIPEGICFVQLWSAAIYLQGIVEGLLGLDPRAHARRLRIHPRLPYSLPSATLRGLRIGEHVIALEVEQGATAITHMEGHAALVVEHVVADIREARLEVRGALARRVTLHREDTGHIISCILEPSEVARITRTTAGAIAVEFSRGA